MMPVLPCIDGAATQPVARLTRTMQRKDPGRRRITRSCRNLTLMSGFKNFVMRGNLAQLAVAAVIGTQFSDLVRQFVQSFINPLLALAGGKPNFEPSRLDENLTLRGWFPREPRAFFGYPQDGGKFSAAASRCVGIGKCRGDESGVMCPSYRVTGRRSTPLFCGAGCLSIAALIHDLGRPARFGSMLRVFKISSPMSVGSWLLGGYVPAAGVAAATAFTGRFPRPGPQPPREPRCSDRRLPGDTVRSLPTWRAQHGGLCRWLSREQVRRGAGPRGRRRRCRGTGCSSAARRSAACCQGR